MFRTLNPLKNYSKKYSRINAENFLKKGIATVSSPNVSLIKLKRLRSDLEQLHEKHSFNRNLACELDSSSPITASISEILLDNNVKNFLRELGTLLAKNVIFSRL